MPGPAGKQNLHLRKALQQTEAISALKSVGRWLHWFWTWLCMVTQQQQMTWHPNHHWLWKLHHRLQAALILWLCTLPPDFGTLISKRITKFILIWKEDFGPFSKGLVLSLLSPGKIPLMLLGVQEWLDNRNSTLVAHFPAVVALEFLAPASVHCLWISPTFLYLFFFTILSSLQSFLLHTHLFRHHLFLLVNFPLICCGTALCEQPGLSAMYFWVLPSVWRLSAIVFWTADKLVPHDCGCVYTEPVWELKGSLQVFWVN